MQQKIWTITISKIVKALGKLGASKKLELFYYL